MKYFDKKAELELKNIAVTNNEKLLVYPGACRYNSRCHHNAVHEAIENGHNRVAATFCLEGDTPVIHFINIDNNGKYTDNTFGHWAKKFDYYLIKFIEKEDFFSISAEFRKIHKEVYGKLKPLTRFFSNIEF